MSRHDLTLREELLLLSLDDKKGAFVNGTALPFGLAGAALMELATRGRAEFEEGFLVAVDGFPTRDAVLDEILDLMSQAKRRKKAKDWVRIIPGKLKKLPNRIALGLVDRGILKETEETLLWVFPVKRYPERTPVPEREIRERIRRAAAGSRRIDERTGPLVALMAACKLTKQVFEKDRRRDADRRVKELLRSDAYGRVVGETVREIHKGVLQALAAARQN